MILSGGAFLAISLILAHPTSPALTGSGGWVRASSCSADGYILTANHVVEGADSVKVALASGDKQFDARSRHRPADGHRGAQDRDRQSLPAITLADSDKLEVGDVVLAVGNPFAVGQTVTMGIISAWDAASASPAMKTSSRPMRLSIRATPAARWWTRKGGW